MYQMIWTVAAGALMVGLASQGFATEAKVNPGEPHKKMDFQTIDTNADGKVTPEEFTAAINSKFDAADANGDGLVSRDELMGAYQKRAEQQADSVMKKYDANGDNSLSKDEMASDKPTRMFTRLDKDGNGELSPEELPSGPQKKIKTN